MAIVHRLYNDLMKGGESIVSAFREEMAREGNKREATVLVSASPHQLDFTCFSVPLRLRVEFDIPKLARMEDEYFEARDGVKGDLALYKRMPDDGIDPFKFAKDDLGVMTSVFRYTASGLPEAYRRLGTSTHERRCKLEEFVPFYLDTLEAHIVGLGLRVVPGDR